MIPGAAFDPKFSWGKPRASGDDPCAAEYDRAAAK